jgi:hypothetical protein
MSLYVAKTIFDPFTKKVEDIFNDKTSFICRKKTIKSNLNEKGPWYNDVNIEIINVRFIQYHSSNKFPNS